MDTPIRFVIRFFYYVLSFWLLLACQLVAAQSVARIGILSFESKSDTATRWQPTANHLHNVMPQQRFEVVPLHYDELNAAVQNGEIDFVMTNPEHYVVLRNAFGIRPMVTLNTLIGTEGYNTFGGVIFMRADRAKGDGLSQVKDKRVAAVGLYSLGGYLAAADALRYQRIDLQSSDVSALDFTGTPHSKVVQAVMDGSADVGLVRTGVLEQMAQQGKLSLDQVQVLNPQPQAQFPQLLSTELFPEWPLAAMPQTPQPLVTSMAVALLSIQPDSSFAHAGHYHGFTTPANYAPVEALMRRAKVFPHVVAEPVWKELWLHFELEIVAAAIALFVTGAGLSVYLWMANRKLRKMTTLYAEAQTGLKVTAAAFESQVGIIVTDAQTHIVRANEAFSKLFGYAEQTLLGSNTSMLRADIIPEKTLRTAWQMLAAKGRWQGELQCRHQDGHEIPCIVAITALRNTDGTITGYVGSFLDISLQKRTESEARQLAFFDPLTELPNRRMFIDRLKAEIRDAGRERVLGALMFIDLDNFTVLNDTYGHTVGDQLLHQIAQRLNALAGNKALAARLGGDEFVVMWPRISTDKFKALEQATNFAWKIRREILDKFELSTPDGDGTGFLQYNTSGSIGVALFGERDEPVTEVLKRADVAMYQSKHGGKNTISIFDQAVQTALNARLALSTELNAALVKGQLALQYQLQTTSEGVEVGAECLLRWKHPQRGMVSPAEFIPLAEESGAIIGIGNWVIYQACATLARWAKVDRLKGLTLSVNVSPKQFIDADFLHRVEKYLEQTGANPQRLCLEITEGIVLQDADKVIEKMHALCAMGLSFSIDDFGTGYSSLSYLQRLPLRELKIDKSFVNDVATNPTSEAIVRTIVALGQSMGIHVLAEGVETDAQRARLAAMGCERIQGYLFAKPMGLDALEQKITLTSHSIW